MESVCLREAEPCTRVPEPVGASMASEWLASDQTSAQRSKGSDPGSEMTESADALLTWRTPAEGGRRVLPSGPKYRAMVHFDGQENPFEKDAWDLVVQFLEPPSVTSRTRARVWFFADEAPTSFLRPGNRFRLLEGNELRGGGHYRRLNQDNENQPTSSRGSGATLGQTLERSIHNRTAVLLRFFGEAAVG